ncbi:hypothetical protein [Hyphomonas atlantica]|uniref:Uncharacterized protein n=1 Tax=Hyphomonas atlantica TaxID=1280948 RepID=A0A059E3E3_9PROT|nr:hypothetical protein [Hyphomonas atlantica]KCZ62067.1 hypothetical protein HY36_16385 [Hyphomonas atlantica]
MRFALRLICLTAAFAIASLAANAESEAKELQRLFSALDNDVSDLLGEVAGFSLQSNYQCPPATPNKEQDGVKLSGFATRHLRLRMRMRVIKTKNEQYGRSGEGQIGRQIKFGFLDSDKDTGNLEAGVDLTRRDTTVAPDDIKRVEGNLDGIRDGVRQLQRDLGRAPPPDQDCDPAADPIASVTVTPPGAVEPGAVLNIPVSATTLSGKAVTITKITVTGAGAIAEPGVTPAYTVNGINTAAGNIRIAVAKIRADRSYNIRVDVEGRPVGVPGPGFTTGRQNAAVSIKNVAPEITSTAFSFSVEPGDTVSIDGEITIVDRNADTNNGNEIDRNRVRLSDHPTDLKTSPRNAFNRWSSKSQTSFDPSKGEYVFKVKREGIIETPHPHGVFAPNIQVTDTGTPQLTTTQPVEITVENVAPEAFLRPTPRDAFHSDDNLPVGLVGTIRDRNGADDVVTIEIDARAAGGQVYRLSNGSIRKTSSDDQGFSFRINPETFAHTRNSGTHKISGRAEDGPGPNSSAPNTVRFETEIKIGNDPPTVGAIGYMTGTELVILKEVCPRGLITVGAQIHDRENDKVKVTATILPGGSPEEMTLNPGSSTYTLVTLAPDKPGQYTIRFDVVETATNEKKKAARSIELVVKPCGLEEEHPQAAAPAAPVEVAIAGNPGSDVQVQPVPPALPGQTSPDLAAAAALSELFYYGWVLDQYSGTYDDPQNSITSTMIDEIFYPYLAWRPIWQDYALLEDYKGVPPVCGAGPGTGPMFDLGQGGPEQAIGAIDELNQDLAKLIESMLTGGDLYQELVVEDFLNQMALEFGDQVPMLKNGSVVPRNSAAPQNATTDTAAARAKTRAQLQSQYDALVERQNRLNASRVGFEEQLATAIENSDDKRVTQIRGFLNEITDLQAGIHAQTTPIAEQLNALDRPQQEAQAQELSSITDEINQAAWDTIATRYGFDTSVQDAKQWTTWVTRWMSVGSGLSYDNDRLVRMSEFSLISAEEKLNIVDGLLEDVDPGSFRETVLNRKKGQFEAQRDSAQQHLDSLDNITKAGFVVDIGLYASGGVLINAGRKMIVGGTSRVLGTQAAERTAIALDTGVVQLTKQATGRATTSAAAGTTGAATSSATSATIREGSEAALGGSSEAATGVFNTAQAAAEHGHRFGAQSMDEAWQAFEAARMAAGIEAPTGLGTASREWLQLWYKFSDDVFNGTVGAADDVIRAGGDEAMDAYWALERAGAQGRQAFRSEAGQAAAQHWDDYFQNLANQPDRVGALNQAREVAGQRGRNRLAELWREAQLESWLQGSEFLGLSPLLFGLMTQDAAAADAPQTKLGTDGRAELNWQIGTSLSMTPKFSLSLSGGGAYEQYDPNWQALGPCLEKKAAAQ